MPFSIDISPRWGEECATKTLLKHSKLVRSTLGYNYVYTLEVTRLGGKKKRPIKNPKQKHLASGGGGFEVSTRKNRKIFSFYAFLNVPRTGGDPYSC